MESVTSGRRMEMVSLYSEYDVEGLSTRGVINGMEDTPGWDALHVF